MQVFGNVPVKRGTGPQSRNEESPSRIKDWFRPSGFAVSGSLPSMISRLMRQRGEIHTCWVNKLLNTPATARHLPDRYSFDPRQGTQVFGTTP